MKSYLQLRHEKFMLHHLHGPDELMWRIWSNH